MTSGILNLPASMVYRSGWLFSPREKNLLTPETMTEAYEGPGKLVNSGPFNGQDNEEAKKAITRHLEEKGRAGKKFNTAYGTGGFPDKGTGVRPSR